MALRVKVGDTVVKSNYDNLMSRYAFVANELNIIDSTYPSAGVSWSTNDNLVSGEGQLNNLIDCVRRAYNKTKTIVSVPVSNVNKMLVKQWAQGTTGKRNLIGLSIEKDDSTHFTVYDGTYITNGITYKLSSSIRKNMYAFSTDAEKAQTFYDRYYENQTNMTSNNSQGVNVWCNEVGSNTWKIFNNNGTRLVFGRYAEANNPIYINFDNGRMFRLTKYLINADAYGKPEAPTQWTIQGSNDNTNWTVIDSRSEPSWSLGQSRTYTFTNNNAYRYYRIAITNQLRTSGLELRGFRFYGYTGRVGYVGNGCLDTGSFQANKTYNVFLIQGSGKSATPIISLSSAPALPSGYTQYTQIGQITTNASTQFNVASYYDAEQVGNDICADHFNGIDTVLTAIEEGLGSYNRNITIFEKDVAGTYTFSVPQNGQYMLYMSGSGGGAAGGSWKSRKKNTGAGGGGGAGFVGKVYLPKGTYTVILGSPGAGGGEKGGDGQPSYFKYETATWLVLNGGIGPYRKFSKTCDMQGAGGTISVSSQLYKFETIIQNNGNGQAGHISTGANGLLTGYKKNNGAIITNGKGGNGTYKGGGYPGEVGYCRVVYLRPYQL